MGYHQEFKVKGGLSGFESLVTRWFHQHCQSGLNRESSGSDLARDSAVTSLIVPLSPLLTSFPSSAEVIREDFLVEGKDTHTLERI